MDVRMENKFTVLDLFSGAGGLSEGFSRSGFRFISHIEMDEYSANTLQTRMLYHALKSAGRADYYYSYISGDVSREEFLTESLRITGLNSTDVINTEISEKNESVLKRRITRKMNEENLREVDVIIGGPPCQSYSLIGRSRDPEGMKKDLRNLLYLRYLSFLKHYTPEIFVFENVPGIMSAKNGIFFTDFVKKAKKNGYVVKEKILDASDFNVLQRRRRMIIIGWKNEHPFEYPEFQSCKHNYRVSSIFEDLPAITPGNGTDGPQDYNGPPSEYLTTTGLRNGVDILIHHQARYHNERDRNIYRKVISVWKKEQRRLKYNELPERLKTHNNRKSFVDRFKVVASDLYHSQSVVAHVSKDGHYYIHPDVKQARSLTVREVARLQSFPDNYKFEGPRTSQYRQVGNAVPPLMATEIAIKIRNMLEAM